MVLLAQTCPSNQWPSVNFWRQVDHNESHEIKEAAALGLPLDRKALREKVFVAIIDFAHPAGNA